MENSQSIQPVPDNDALNKEAETSYGQFIDQIYARSGGLQSESEHGKIYSFETYLREKGVAAELVQAYCNYVKTSGFAERFAAERNQPVNVYLSNARVILISFFISWVPGIFLYLLVGAFLSTFAISIWSIKPFLFFALSGPVLITVVLLLKFKSIRKEMKAGTNRPQYVIKYFDNDELVFAKSKSRLFVEK